MIKMSNILEQLQSIKGTQIEPTDVDVTKLKAGASDIGITYIPPCNAVGYLGTLTKYIPALDSTFKSGPLPKNFNWCVIDENDSSLMQAKWLWKLLGSFNC